MAVLHTHEFGDGAGAPLLALHGVTGHGRRYRRLGDEGWPDRRTVAVDLRGHGRSTSDGPWNVQQHVDDLIDTLDALELPELDVVGHSYGGTIALALLARAPERVRTLALLDPALTVTAEMADLAALSMIADQGFATVDEAVAFRTGGDERLTETVAAEVADHLVEGDDGRYRFRFHRPAAITAWGEMCAALPAQVEPRPALLVVATQAPFVTPAVEAGLAGLLGDHLATVRLDCGHLLYWERFDETAGAVRDFLSATR
jgi:lipase